MLRTAADPRLLSSHKPNLRGIISGRRRRGKRLEANLTWCHVRRVASWTAVTDPPSLSAILPRSGCDGGPGLVGERAACGAHDGVEGGAGAGGDGGAGRTRGLGGRAGGAGRAR